MLDRSWLDDTAIQPNNYHNISVSKSFSLCEDGPTMGKSSGKLAGGSTLFYGDNLPVLREHIPDESVDLIYLDPPFNSKRDYSVLFQEHDAADSEAQIHAFEDFWTWDHAAERTYTELTKPGAEAQGVPGRLVHLLEALWVFLEKTDMMAYLVMMAIRLIELRRVLKRSGSIYLHCDPTASHYLKILIDAIFGPERFLSEIIWKRTHAHSSARRYGPIHDVILYYSKDQEYEWTDVRLPHDVSYIKKEFTRIDNSGRSFSAITLTGSGVRRGDSGKAWRNINPTKVGRHWAISGDTLEKLGIAEIADKSVQEKLDILDSRGMIHWPNKKDGTPRLKWYADQLDGMTMPDLWTDIAPLSVNAAERLGYPTQKPLALLERIISASSKEGDVILDPFCGCGTAIHAAQRLNRRWIGIDITHLAIGIIRKRLNGAFPDIRFNVFGEPADGGSAASLAESDPYQFQWWALHLIGARPAGDSADGGKVGKKGKDRGIDGVIRFLDDPRAKQSHRIIISVKAGKNLNPGMVRDLRGTIEREKAPIGVLLTLHKPTREMRSEAAQAGTWRSETWGKEYQRIQIVTIPEIFAGTNGVKYPGQDVTLKAAPTDHPKHTILPLPGIEPVAPKPKKAKRKAG